MSDHVDLTKCGPKCILELQEAVTEAEMRANALESQNQALQERIEKLELALWGITSLEGSTEILAQNLKAIARNALSPTQETDPGDDRRGGIYETSGYKRVLHPRPTQETDPR